MTIDPEIVIRLSFERKICLLVSNWRFFITLVKAVLTLSRDCYILSLSVFSRDFLVLLLMIAASAAVIAAAYFLYSHVYNSFMYWDRWSAFSFAVNLFNYILLCCRVSSTSFNWLPYFFKVCVWGLKKCKFLHPLFFSLKCSQLFCPWRLHLGFPTGCLALFPLFFVWRRSYIFPFIYLKYSSPETELLNYLVTWPSGYLQGWRWGVKEMCLRLYILMLGACHGFYDQGKVYPWKPSRAVGDQVTCKPCRHTGMVLLQFWNLTLESGAGRIPSHNTLPATYLFQVWGFCSGSVSCQWTWLFWVLVHLHSVWPRWFFPTAYPLGLPPDFSVFMLQKTLLKQPLPSLQLRGGGTL